MPETVRVLAIDREEIILKSIVKALTAKGSTTFAVTTTTSALEGLKIVRNDVFDVVFVDVAMAGLNSAELLRRIKHTSPSVSVILTSGHLSGKSFPEEVSTNADGFLSKPFTAGEIRSLLSSILRKRKG